MGLFHVIVNSNTPTEATAVVVQFEGSWRRSGFLRPVTTQLRCEMMPDALVSASPRKPNQIERAPSLVLVNELVTHTLHRRNANATADEQKEAVPLGLDIDLGLCKQENNMDK